MGEFKKKLKEMNDKIETSRKKCKDLEDRIYSDEYKWMREDGST